MFSIRDSFQLFLDWAFFQASLLFLIFLFFYLTMLNSKKQNKIRLNRQIQVFSLSLIDFPDNEELADAVADATQ